ncbi:hypothetical protein [Paenarthrobacter nitroguajacolicus]|uniref:hypothetical protein n=1 Tax=Paenarthrobacter nitroguajacolicus TaxID=211146 RepID=UPI00248C9594|nr:hypothetical protein [Paenarthrobacter nitroguajacolicus]MDI2034444.1 hypothetical protein [Paenarthrobacter nitroguajacolicus]
MKYHRSCFAKTATLGSLALALTLIACTPAVPQASTSTTKAALIDPLLPSSEPGTADPAGGPVLFEEPALAIVPVPAADGPAAVPAPATPAPQPTASADAEAGECTPGNIDIQRHDQVRAINPIPVNEQQYYTVLGCAEGWLAFSISDEGVRTIGLDGGNAWYNIATLQSNGRYLTDYAQRWTSVYNWEFQGFAVRNGEFATAQEAMDHEFAANGIPVRLREQLVGAGPAVPAPGGPAAGECTPANIDIQRNDTVRAIKPIPTEQQQY